MTQYMKMHEVAAYLGRCNDQVRRYRDKGLHPDHKEGKELFYDRAAVVAFAQAHGIRTAETVQPTGDITIINITPEKAEDFMIFVAGVVDRWNKDKIDAEQGARKIYAASGTVVAPQVF